MLASTLIDLLASSALMRGVSASFDCPDGNVCECGCCFTGEPTAHIAKPANRHTVKISAAAQQFEEDVTFEVVYCSAEYFKTSTLHVDTWLEQDHRFDVSNGQHSYIADGLSIGTKPTNDGTVAGAFSGYKYNVTVSPFDNEYPSGKRILSVYEVATGYYTPNVVQLHSIELNFVLEPLNSTKAS